MDENLIKRIGDEYLQADHKDGETFLHTDYNEFLSIFKTSINENYYDIQRITNGTLKVYNTAKLDGATLSRSVNGSLSSDDNTIPSSKQVKIYVDNYYNELNKKDEALSTTVSGAVSASNTAIDTANDAAFNASNALDIATQASSQASRADFNAENAMNIATELSRTKADITEMEKRALTTETGNKLSFSVDPSTYVLTIKLLDKLNNVLSTGTVDLPIESLVMNASYDDETKSITLTLQNGEKVSFSVSALVEGLVSEDTFNQSIEQLKNDLRTELTQTITDDANSSFNQNVQNKTDSFNDNSSLKISEFNNNAAQKTLDYNNNFISKTNSFNQNSTQKVTEFNDNYTSKLNSFNSNADLRMDEYNANADLRMDEYNANADLVLSSIPKNNAEGTDNVFDDGLESPLFALGGDGESEQVVTTGKQLFNKSEYDYLDTAISESGLGTQAIGIYKSIYISCKSNTTYTVSKEKDATKNRFGVAYSDAIPTYSMNTKGNIINNDAEYLTITTDSTASYLIAYIWITGQTLSFEDVLDTLQIEEGSVATEYEQYSNKIPSPSPDYEQPINSIEGSLEFADRGKNLCNGVNQNYYINIAGNTAGYAVGDSGLAIDVSEYSQLTISTKENQERYRAACVTSLPTGSSSSVVTAYNGVVKDGTNNAITIDTTNYNYLIINATNLSVIQVEDGSVATKIEPYVEPNEVTFNLNEEKLRSVGDVKDELVVDLSTGDYYKVENFKEIILDGSESWNDQGNGAYATNISDKYNRYGTDGILCNYFSLRTGTSTSDYKGMDNDTTRIRFWNIGMSLEDFKLWLSTKNVKVNYQLQTPTTKKLGTLSAEDLAKLKTFKGYNNVTVNTNLGLMNIRFTYGLDIKKYVDNELLQLEQNIITNLLNIMPETVQAGIVDKEVNSLIGGI